jgi:hypothetical protein
MRLILKPGLAPLSQEEAREMLKQHIPYRLSLLKDGYWPHWSSEITQRTNQAFEAGAVSGRILLSFLGLKCGKKSGELETDISHDSINKKTTDDVKAPDVGGEFVDLESLPPEDRNTLAIFIRGVNKACAHFTCRSKHQLDLKTYAAAAPVIFRLMSEKFPDYTSSWPKWST